MFTNTLQNYNVQCVDTLFIICTYFSSIYKYKNVLSINLVLKIVSHRIHYKNAMKLFAQLFAAIGNYFRITFYIPKKI